MMRIWVRRVRGVLAFAAIWAVVWVPAGLLLDFLFAAAGHALHASLQELGVFTALGAASGAVFAALLALLERHRALEQLSSRRLAVWGALAGALLPIGGSLVALAVFRGSKLLMPDTAFLFAFVASLGAGCAWTTLALARRGPAVESIAPPT